VVVVNSQFGTKIFSSITAGTGTVEISYDPGFSLGSDVTGLQDVLVVGWREIAGNAASACTSLVWRES